MFAPGEIIRIDFPSHPWHGRTVTVERDVEDFDLAPEDGESCLTRVIFCRGPGVRVPIGLAPEHIAGTVEAQQRRRWDDEGSDGSQGELAL